MTAVGRHEINGQRTAGIDHAHRPGDALICGNHRQPAINTHALGFGIAVGYAAGGSAATSEPRSQAPARLRLGGQLGFAVRIGDTGHPDRCRSGLQRGQQTAFHKPAARRIEAPLRRTVAHIELQDHVADLRLNSPPLNACTVPPTSSSRAPQWSRPATVPTTERAPLVKTTG